VGIADLIDWDDLGNGRGGIEPLGDAPRKAPLLGFILNVAEGHVEPDPVPQNVAVCGSPANMLPLFPDCDDQFDLVVRFPGDAGDDDGFAVMDDGCAGLQKDNRRLGDLRMHFPGMLRIVSPEAKNLAHREGFKLAANLYRFHKSAQNIPINRHFCKAFAYCDMDHELLIIAGNNPYIVRRS
jgi:hypothetical protein